MTTFEAAHDAEELQRAARDHLWLHFTRMGGGDPPIIVRGDGCYLEDSKGNRYLDALAGLFSVNLGYGYGEEIGQAALEQMRELPFYTNWSYAHPRAIELAAELASLAPGDLNRAFFVSGGSEAVESAWKLARQYHVARDEARLRAIAVTLPSGGEPETRHDAIVSEMRRPPNRYKAIARHIAYHGTTMGALSINGIPALRTPFEPLVPEVRHVHNTNRYHRPAGETEEEFTRVPARRPRADDRRQAGRRRSHGDHGAGAERRRRVHRRPPATGRACARSATSYGILLCADEVITGFGRLGDWFGSEQLRHPARPHHVREGALVRVRRHRRGHRHRPRDASRSSTSTSMYSHGITFGGHPVVCAIALKNIEIMKRERIVEHVLENEAALPRDARAAARAADRRRPPRHGLLLRARARQGQGDARDVQRRGVRDRCCAASSRRALFERGLICRADDRGDPVIQISPPLVGDAAGVRRDDRHPRRRARRGMGASQQRREHVSTDPQLIEQTTTLALEEKRQADQVAAAVRHGVLHRLRVRRARHARNGCDERPARASSGSCVLAILFVVPYMLLMAEVGSAFTQEGGPYEWMKLAFGRFHGGIAAILYWVTNPLWVGGSLAFIATAAWSSNVSGIGSGSFGDYFFKLLFIWISIGVAIISLRYGKWIPNAGAILRVVVLGFFSITVIIYGIKHGVAGFAVSDMSPTRAIFFGLVPLLLFNYVGFELQNGAAEEMENPQKDVPLSVLRSGIIGVAHVRDPDPLHPARAAGRRP